MAGHVTGNPYKWDIKPGTNGPHISRYFMAKGFVFPWETVLDAACCTGYGSKMLALQAKHVIGYEVDEGCIEAANILRPDNVEFHVRDLNTCELPDVDVAVSIETMEHLTPDGLLHFTSQLRQHVKRCIVMTVPLGGTSFAYVNEPPGPATEKNDFFSEKDVIDVVAPENSDWRMFFDFRLGYSYFGIFARKEEHIEIPEEWKRRGFNE